MAKIRRVDDVRNITTTRADVVENTLKNVTKDMGGSVSTFLDNAQPMYTNWYHIDYQASHIGKGFEDTDGPYDGGIKYLLIRDFIVYGYQDQRGVDTEEGENVDIHYTIENLTFLIAPGTLNPRIGDRVSLRVENHRFLYKVIKAVPESFRNKPYIRVELSKDTVKSSDYYEEDFKRDNLLTNIYEYVEGNVGSDYSPFVKRTDLDIINKLSAYKEEIMSQYHDYFYDEYKNVFISTDPLYKGFYCYTPLLVDLQMEFRTLWTYGINTILTHETITNKKSIYSYKKNPVRRFLNRLDGSWEKLKTEGIPFSEYFYSKDISDPVFKLNSYLNDSYKYIVFDYYHGDNVMLDGDDIITIQNKRVLHIPTGIHELCEKYYNDTIDPEWLLKFLSEFDFEICFMCKIMVFIVLTIIDKVIISHKAMDNNRGILT